MRIDLHWRVDLLVLGEMGAIEAEIRNISSSGFCCSSPIPFEPGERMVCILKVPSYHPEQRGGTIPLECQVRVVRVDPPNSDGLYSLGFEISDYRIIHT